MPKFESITWLVILMLMLGFNLLSVFSWRRRNLDRKLYECSDLRLTLIGLCLLSTWLSNKSEGVVAWALLLATFLMIIGLIVIFRLQSKIKKRENSEEGLGLAAQIESQVTEAKEKLESNYRTENKKADPGGSA